MTPFNELRPFILHMLWKGVKTLGECCLGILALFWIAGWVIIAPIQFVVMYMTNEVPLWAMLLAVVFWVVPAVYFIVMYLMDAWDNYLLSKGYTKS
jgi:hypothetical protein